MERKEFTNSMKKIVLEKEAAILGEYGCKGYNTYGPWKIIGGMNKKHPTEAEIMSAVEFFDKTEDWGRKAKAWYYRGRINQDLGDALHAQDYYLKALQDENQINDYILIGRIYSSIGMLYTYQNVYEKALPYQRKALDRFALMQHRLSYLCLPEVHLSLTS